MTTRIAMWSGPRSLSTALMRSFGARGDCAVSDEPLYAFYLDRTGIPHPGRDEILASMSRDPGDVTRALTGPVPGGHAVWYQKHMAHHLLPEAGRTWLADVRNAFLIRDPRDVVASYGRVRDRVTVADLGFVQQAGIYRYVTDELGQVAPVIDHRDVLRDPAGVLQALCAALDVPWTDAMLSWAPGPRPEDGVWAKHWYDAVNRSTGFAPSRPTPATLTPEQHALAQAAEPAYRALWPQRLTA